MRINELELIIRQTKIERDEIVDQINFYKSKYEKKKVKVQRLKAVIHDFESQSSDITIELQRVQRIRDEFEERLKEKDALIERLNSRIIDLQEAENSTGDQNLIWQEKLEKKKNKARQVEEFI